MSSAPGTPAIVHLMHGLALWTALACSACGGTRRSPPLAHPSGSAQSTERVGHAGRAEHAPRAAPAEPAGAANDDPPCQTLERASIARVRAHVEDTAAPLDLVIGDADSPSSRVMPLGPDPIELTDASDGIAFGVRERRDSTILLRGDVPQKLGSYRRTGKNTGNALRRLPLAGGGTLVLDIDVRIMVAEC